MTTTTTTTTADEIVDQMLDIDFSGDDINYVLFSEEHSSVDVPKDPAVLREIARRLHDAAEKVEAKQKVDEDDTEVRS